MFFVKVAIYIFFSLPEDKICSFFFFKINKFSSYKNNNTITSTVAIIFIISFKGQTYIYTRGGQKNAAASMISRWHAWNAVSSITSSRSLIYIFYIYYILTLCISLSPQQCISHSNSSFAPPTSAYNTLIILLPTRDTFQCYIKIPFFF